MNTVSANLHPCLCTTGYRRIKIGSKPSINLYPVHRISGILQSLKVAEHSFQVPLLNTPLLLNYLCNGARFLQEPSLTTEVYILAGVCAVAMATGLVKNKA